MPHRRPEASYWSMSRTSIHGACQVLLLGEGGVRSVGASPGLEKNPARGPQADAPPPHRGFCPVALQWSCKSKIPVFCMDSISKRLMHFVSRFNNRTVYRTIFPPFYTCTCLCHHFAFGFICFIYAIFTYYLKCTRTHLYGRALTHI